MKNSEKVIEILEEIKQGRMVIVTDDEDRENEGDLIMAAELVTPESVTFMANHGRGLICVPLHESYAKHFDLSLMCEEGDEFGTAFTISCDVKEGTTTGISGADRAKTIKALTNMDNRPEDFHRPGHVFPLIARSGGVLERAGHTEAAVDLALMAGLAPAGVICEIISDDGTMTRGEDLKNFAQEFGLKQITIKELIEYRRSLQVDSVVNLPTNHGEFKVETIPNPDCKDMPHLLIYKGDIQEHTLLRIHSECFTGDILGSLRCDCGDQLQKSLSLINDRGGAVIYMRQEGRGIGLENKLSTYVLQENGVDTLDANLMLGFKADARDYTVAAETLKRRGVGSVDLITNNPAKITALESCGITVKSRIKLETVKHNFNKNYIETKIERMGHLV